MDTWVACFPFLKPSSLPWVYHRVFSIKISKIIIKWADSSTTPSTQDSLGECNQKLRTGTPLDWKLTTGPWPTPMTDTGGLWWLTHAVPALGGRGKWTARVQSLKWAGSTQGVPGQPGLYSETVSQNKTPRLLHWAKSNTIRWLQTIQKHQVGTIVVRRLTGICKVLLQSHYYSSKK